jgi:hypothetical protein
MVCGLGFGPADLSEVTIEYFSDSKSRFNAIQALSQLSYGPFRDQISRIGHQDEAAVCILTPES